MSWARLHSPGVGWANDGNGSSARLFNCSFTFLSLSGEVTGDRATRFGETGMAACSTLTGNVADVRKVERVAGIPGNSRM